MAGQWCEQLYRRLWAFLFGAPPPPNASEQWIHFVAHKSVHVALFLVFAVLLWNALPEIRWKFALIVLIGLVAGTCSELLQRLFPDRDPSVRDVLINVSATVLGAAICLARKRERFTPV